MEVKFNLFTLNLAETVKITAETGVQYWIHVILSVYSRNFVAITKPNCCNTLPWFFVYLKEC